MHQCILLVLVHKQADPNINWIDSELLENEFYKERLDEYKKSEKLDAILIP